jgi:xanthine dehydrogenase FAD-binding subunit
VRVVHDGSTVTGARIALGAVAPVPLRVPAAEEALVGVEISDDAGLRAAVAAAADVCRSMARPIDDTRASARYRTSMVEVVAGRCVDAALARSVGRT